MLEIRNIHKSFGDQTVLKGVDMSFELGKIYTLIGGNGSGKTTLFNIITGFLNPDSGSIIFNGKKFGKRTSPVRINSKGITRTFQDLRLITSLTVKDNILLAFKGNPGENPLNSLLPQYIFKKKYDFFSIKADDILEKIHLTSVCNNLAGEISYGQQKLLTLGCCIANDAKLLLLDEPIAGIDKENYNRIVELIDNLKTSGKTILQIEHNKEYIAQTSDFVYLLENGVAKTFDKLTLN